MRRLPPLNAVRAFEAAARHVSFTKAAEELYVTHGAVSRQVAGLEDWFGVRFFRRSPSQLTLTEAGAVYFREVTAVLDRLALASQDVRDHAAPTALRINAPPTFTMRWLIRRLSGFQLKHPGVELRPAASLAPIHAAELGFDVAIRGDAGEAAGWSDVRFMTEIIAPVCRPDRAAGGRLSVPEDLAGETLITYQTEPYAWPQWVERIGAASPSQPTHLRFEQMFFALQAVQDGLGVGLFPLFLIIDELVAGRLCVPFGPLGARRRQYRAFHRPDAEGLPLIQSFCAWLQEAGRGTEASTDAWARSMGWGAMTADAAA